MKQSSRLEISGAPHLVSCPSQPILKPGVCFGVLCSCCGPCILLQVLRILTLLSIDWSDVYMWCTPS